MSENNTAETTRRGIEIRMPNNGTLFPRRDDPIEYQGAIRVGDVTYDVTTTRQDSRTGMKFYRLKGSARGDATKTIDGALFAKEAKISATGNATPAFTGDITMYPERTRKELAAWDRVSANSGAPYLSLSVREYRERQTQTA